MREVNDRQSHAMTPVTGEVRVLTDRITNGLLRPGVSLQELMI